MSQVSWPTLGQSLPNPEVDKDSRFSVPFLSMLTLGIRHLLTDFTLAVPFWTFFYSINLIRGLKIWTVQASHLLWKCWKLQHLGMQWFLDKFSTLLCSVFWDKEMKQHVIMVSFCQDNPCPGCCEAHAHIYINTTCAWTAVTSLIRKCPIKGLLKEKWWRDRRSRSFGFRDWHKCMHLFYFPVNENCKLIKLVWENSSSSYNLSWLQGCH